MRAAMEEITASAQDLAKMAERLNEISKSFNIQKQAEFIEEVDEAEAEIRRRVEEELRRRLARKK